jgi:predicted transcriptional regulator
VKTKEEKMNEIVELSQKGMSARQIGIELSYSASTVNRYLREWRVGWSYDIGPVQLDIDSFMNLNNESIMQDIHIEGLAVTAIKMYCIIVNAYRDTGSVEVNLAPFLPKL